VSSGSGPHLSSREDSRATTCTVAPDLTSLLGRALEPPCNLRFRTLPPCQKGSGAVTCLKHKKNLAGMPKQLDLCVFKACTHISKTLDIRVIMDLQNMWIDDTFNAYMMCGQTATV
jgi:hypothetical protein